MQLTKKILILPGDGIGQEVTHSAKEILDFLINEYHLNFEITEMDVGGTAFDNHGSPLPDNVLEEAKKSDAILFGAVGGPKWDDLSWVN
jgi:3-isopropylmalate dehydrogenase